METVSVNLGTRSYDILVGHGILDQLGSAYQNLGLGKRAAIVTNPTVSALYLAPVLKSLEDAGVSVHVVTVPDGEQYKTLQTVGDIQGSWRTVHRGRLIRRPNHRGRFIHGDEVDALWSNGKRYR